MAAQQEFLSFKFFFFYGLVLLILFAYAIAWQQVLKGLPLVTAYANKAVTVIWKLVLGSAFFSGENYVAESNWGVHYYFWSVFSSIRRRGV